MSGARYLPESILWHLLEEGTASMADLARLTGRPRLYIAAAMRPMRVCGQVQQAQRLHQPPAASKSHLLLFALTPAGIEAARRVDRSIVAFATTTQPEETAS